VILFLIKVLILPLVLRYRRCSIDFKAFVNKSVNLFADYFNVLSVVRSHPAFAQFGCLAQFGIKINDSTGGCVHVLGLWIAIKHLTVLVFRFLDVTFHGGDASII